MRLATPLRSEGKFDCAPTGDGGTGRPRSIRARVKISPVEAEAPFGELSASRGLRPLSSGWNSTSIDHAGSRKPGGAIVRRPSLTQAEARPRPWLASASRPCWNRSPVASSYCSTIPRRTEPTPRQAQRAVRVAEERGRATWTRQEASAPEERSERRASHQRQATDSVSGRSNAGPARSAAKHRRHSRANHNRQA